MKKLIIAIFVALVLGACSQAAGDKFVGTWTINEKRTMTMAPDEIMVANNDGKYTVELGKNKYEGQIKGELLIFEMPVFGKVTLSIKNNNLVYDGYEYHKNS